MSGSAVSWLLGLPGPFFFTGLTDGAGAGAETRGGAEEAGGAEETGGAAGAGELSLHARFWPGWGCILNGSQLNLRDRLAYA